MRSDGYYYPSQYKDKDGYLEVSLCYKGNVRRVRAHRAVAASFLGDHPDMQVNHINGNKADNRIENLEWVTRSGNIRHRIYSLGVQPPVKTRRIKCIETGTVYPSVRAAARAVGTPHSNIVVCAGKKPTHHTAGGYHWEYA